MPYASASGRSLQRAPHRTPGHDGRPAAAGKDERGDMTRLRGARPPVVSAMRLLTRQPVAAPRAGSVHAAVDDANQ